MSPVEALSWVAAGWTMLGLWWLADPKRRHHGWFANIIGSWNWGAYAIITDQWALLTVNVVIAILNVRGLVRELLP